MLRLLLLSLALLSFVPAAHAVIVYEPSPVPCGDRYVAPRLDPYYQRQLQVLNQPYRMYAPNMYTAQACPQPTVDLLQTPCVEAPLYYRKSDLLPRAMIRRATDLATPKGTILIIPKTLLDRPLNSFAPMKKV